MSSQKQNAPRLCRVFAEKGTKAPNLHSSLFSAATESPAGDGTRKYSANRISFFAGSDWQSSQMDASGMPVQFMQPDQKQTRPFGVRNWPPTKPVTCWLRGRCNRKVGGLFGFGNTTLRPKRKTKPSAEFLPHFVERLSGDAKKSWH